MLSRHLGLFNDKLNVNVEAIEIIEDIGDLESDGD